MVPLLSRGIIAPVFALACLAALPVEADQISDQVFEVPPLRGETVRVTNEQIDLLVQAQPDALVLDPASLSRLRAQVRDVLLERALLERGALEAGLNYDARVQQELEAARQSVLAAAFLRQLSDPSSVTDAEIEAEYQRAIEQLADVEYQMRRLTFLSREEAQAAADALNADTDFLEVMGSFGGIHPADGAPGKWRWIAASRMPLPVRENIRLQASDPTLGASPVLVEGTWYVLQVQDQRGAEVPKLAEIENVLREQIAQARAQTWLRERQEQEMIREDDGQSAVLATGGHDQHASDHSSQGSTLTERIAYMTGHFEAGVLLYRTGNVEAALGHLSHPFAEAHRAEWEGLDSYGFEQHLFLDLHRMIEQGHPASHIEPSIAAAKDNLYQVAAAAGSDPWEMYKFILSAAAEQYPQAVDANSVVDEKVFQDIGGYLMVAKYWAAFLQDRSVIYVDLLEKLLQQHRDISFVAPMAQGEFVDAIQTLTSEP